jgi:hypothetical protein
MKNMVYHNDCGQCRDFICMAACEWLELHLELGRIGEIMLIYTNTLIEGSILYLHEKCIEMMRKTCKKHCTTYIN